MKNKIGEQLFKQKVYFKSGITKELPHRISALKKLKESILINENEIIKALKTDLGKPLLESYTAEIASLIHEINTMLKNLKRWTKPTKTRGTILDFPSKNLIVKEPFGAALIIGTWNFPFQLTLSPLIGAIAAGNVAIVKPSEVSIECSKVINKIISEAFEKDFIAVEEGGIEVVSNLLDLPFDKIFFTGSPEIGKKIMMSASEHLADITLELGGKSPCIIDKDIDMDVVVKRVLIGKFMNVGQTCVAPDYIIIHESIKNQFIDSVKKYIKVFWGDHIITNPDYGRVVNSRHFNRLIELIDKDNILIGGKHNERELFIEPTFIDVKTLDSELMTQEIFGPLFPVLTYSSTDEIVKITDKTPNPLALYIFSKNNRLVDKLITLIPSGGVCVNDTISQILNNRLPFGGRGTSGGGNYHGKFSIEAFSHTRAVLKRGFKVDLPIKYPPFKNGHEMIKTYMLR